MPEPGKLLDSRLGYYIRPGKHSMTREDWKIFLDFADKHLGKLRAENEDEKMKSISLQLEAIERSVKAGVVPKFQLTLRNEGKAAVKVLDICDNRRVDLQDTYYDLEIRRGKELVKLPRAISDPGPISDDDFTSLGAGAKLSFKLTRFALALEELPPGKYKARVQFWKDPFQTSKTCCYYSSEAEFTFEK